MTAGTLEFPTQMIKERRNQNVRPIAIVRCFAACCLWIGTPGCIGWFEGSTQQIGYVLRKGDAKAIGEWTMKQTDGRKIWDGCSALTYLVVEAQNNTNKAEDAIKWCVVVADRIEDWPPDQIIPADSGEHFTTSDLVDHIFFSAAFDAYYHPNSEELLHRLRPNNEHMQWLDEWEKCVADLENDRQQARKIAAENTIRQGATQPDNGDK